MRCQRPPVQVKYNQSAGRVHVCSFGEMDFIIYTGTGADAEDFQVTHPP